jgi:ChrR Cupin-like domain
VHYGGIRILAHAHVAYHIVPGDGGAWIAVDAKLEMKILYKDSRAASFLLRLKPGARLPSHVHAANEECLMLEGELRYAEGVTLRAGDYQFPPKICRMASRKAPPAPWCSYTVKSAPTKNRLLAHNGHPQIANLTAHLIAALGGALILL